MLGPTLFIVIGPWSMGRKDAPALPDGTADIHVKADEALQSIASAAAATARVAVRPAARPFEQ